MFTNEFGGPVDPMNLYHRFVALAAKAGVPRIPLQGEAARDVEEGKG